MFPQEQVDEQVLKHFLRFFQLCCRQG